MTLLEEQLHNYQTTAKNSILNVYKDFLMMEMGLGKTAATLTAIRDLMYREFEVEGVLVIAPKRVASKVWSDEIKKWAHLRHMTISKIQGTPKQRAAALAAKADIYTLGRDNVVWYFEQLNRPETSMLVIDESTSFKSHASKRFKALKKHAYKFKRVVLLTGTPAPNGYMDLWSQFFLLDSGKRLERTIGNYRKEYFHAGFSNGHIVYRYDLNKGAKKEIHNKIEDITVSMKTKDYLELPGRVDNVINLEMPAKLKSRYKDFQKELVLSLRDTDITALNAAALSIKLLQFCNGAVYDEDRGVHDIHDIKLDALEELLDCGKPILLAWSFQHDRDRILKRFAKLNPRNLKTDQDIDDWNDGKIKLMLMHPASGGHGLNLQRGGHTIVWFGQTWNLELDQQFNARLDRQGQNEVVIINRLVMEGTIEVDVMKSLATKDGSQQGLMKAVKNIVSDYCFS